LFPTRHAGSVDWQKLAAATAVLRSLSVISGGPGTGKTTTVAKILALLRRQPGGNTLRIALAAPTGKAAARMQQSIRQVKAGNRWESILIADIPEQASTLHRLLGFRPGENRFRHHRDNPLPVDVLILDEASMIDVALMAKVLDALPVTARLILLGDKDQLASVEAGAVLGDICSPCHEPSAKFVATLAELTGEPVDALETTDMGLCDVVVVLRRSYRFAADSPIGVLAKAVNQGDVIRVRACMTQDTEGILRWSDVAEVVDQAAQRYLTLFKQVAAGAPPEALFEELDRFRLLCALRQGPTGAVTLNQHIAMRLSQHGVPTSQEWYAGRPIMITRNDHQMRLYNGDIGITLPDPNREGNLGVVFMGDDCSKRWLAPARLPPHESLYTMTVHKSQGSEFDEVLLLLPEQDSPALSRELVYTAVTRARRRFSLAAKAAVFEAAVTRRRVRQSGLRELLTSDSFLTT
jgi:exodeoxyribonuclease V alpha subunit